MKKIENIAEVRKVQLGILDYVDSFCKSHNIIYYLCGGTMLGAIRHKGYIPWDDDIDIMMPRKDYEVFLREFSASDTSFYGLVEHRVQRNYPYPFAKVEDSRTFLKEHFDDAFDQGINIDIFPLDSMPKGKENYTPFIEKRIKYKKYLHLKEDNFFKLSFEDGLGKFFNTIYRNVKLALQKVYLCGYSITKLVDLLDENGQKATAAGSPAYMGNFTWGYAYKELCPIEHCKEIIEVEFEGKMYPAPKGYDVYLSGLFGNYMQLPPEGQRTTHSFDAFWK